MAAKQKPKPDAAPNWPKDSERWLAVAGFDGYEVSDLGRVRSLDRRLPFMTRWGTETTRLHRGRILRLKRTPNDYHQFYADGGSYLHVNRTVCRAFHGDPPTSKHEAAHLNGNSLDDRAENLVWATPVENCAHKRWHGTDSAGSKNGQAKLNEANVTAIFEAFVLGVNTADIAARYRVSEGTIKAVVGSVIWKHVDVGELRALAKMRLRLNLERSWVLAAERRRERGVSLLEATQ